MESHLLQMRGLKHDIFKLVISFRQVASFTDAWIETASGFCTSPNKSVASFTDAWIETRISLGLE